MIQISSTSWLMPPSCGHTSMRLAQKGNSKWSPRSFAWRIHIAVDAIGHPLRMILTAGQVHEATQATVAAAGRQINDPAAHKRASIINGHNSGLTVVPVRWSAPPPLIYCDRKRGIEHALNILAKVAVAIEQQALPVH
jgi:hypothetical protein